jgi:hypothetical protein
MARPEHTPNDWFVIGLLVGHANVLYGLRSAASKPEVDVDDASLHTRPSP